MKNILSNALTYIILILLIIYKSTFINIVNNINKYTYNKEINEVKILNDKIDFLENEYNKLVDFKVDNIYDYEITRLSLKSSYLSNKFYIYGGKDTGIQEKDYIANNDGLVGIITKVYDNYSECKLLTSINDLTVSINDTYGTLFTYEDDLLIINNISNYSNIHINDDVYTSDLGDKKEKIFIGKVYKIIDDDISKKIYVKSNVNFNKLDYLYIIK